MKTINQHWTALKFFAQEHTMNIAIVNMRDLLAGLVTLLICATAPVGRAEKEVSLMGTLAEWKYPDSKFHGAQMSDGGNPQIPSIKCKAVLTTADPMSKVVEFYEKKLEIQLAAKSPANEGEQKPAESRSVTVQKDSDGRPVAIQVIVINREKSSTTLVISRAEAENETHIAWLHYLRF